MRVLLLSIVVALSSGTPLADPARQAPRDSALDWPQWRGIHRDAVSTETGLLDRWPSGGPPVIWRTTVGSGFSSVSVSGDKLYTLGDLDDSQFVLCLDADTGEELWRRKLGPAFRHPYGDGPRSTPLVEGQRVFAVGTQGRLVALNRHTGELLWQHDLVTEYAARLPSYGYSSSPMVVKGKLVLEAGGERASFMAFDLRSGKVVWTAGDDRPAYSSPLQVSIGGIDQIVFWSAHGLNAVSPDNGAPLWEYAWETFCPVTGDPLNTGTPIFIAPDRLFISSSSGAAVIRVSRAGEQFEVDTVWESTQMRSDINTALLHQGYIYGFDGGMLKCLDARTGEPRWRARGFRRGSLIAADGKLIVLGEAGNLALLNADPDRYVERGSAKVLEGRNWTAPSLAAGRLYLRNHRELVCLELTDRETR